MSLGNYRLLGNPVCSNVLLSQTSYCLPQQETPPSYSTEVTKCGSKSCLKDYNCSNPYEGEMVFRAPFFQDVTNVSVFELLKESVWKRFGSSLGSVSLQNPFFNSYSYLLVELKLCPSSGSHFNRSQILIELDLSSQNYNPPAIFGPYYFNASSYPFPGAKILDKISIVIFFGVNTDITLYFSWIRYRERSDYWSCSWLYIAGCRTSGHWDVCLPSKETGWKSHRNK